MVTQLELKAKSLYDSDYNLWVLETVKLLQEGNFNQIDLDNLIEEVLDLSRRDKHKIKSLLRRLFEHLLKLTYWESAKDYSKAHWEGEIINFRQQIIDELEDSPSLKRYLSEVFNECYQDGRKIAAKKSRLPLNTFPESPIGNVEQILDENWLP
jgi:hypothetical protein